MGVIGELFVVISPFDVPQREPEAHSRLALFQSQGLQFEAADYLDKFVSLRDELEEGFSDKRVKFIFEKGGIWILRIVALYPERGGITMCNTAICSLFSFVGTSLCTARLRSLETFVTQPPSCC